MSRAILAIIFGLGTAGLALFFWQKQAANYNFSLDKEKEAFKGVGESVQEYKKNLPRFEISDEFTKKFEKFRLEKYGTTTPDYAMSTSSEEDLEGFFEPL